MTHREMSNFVFENNNILNNSPGETGLIWNGWDSRISLTEAESTYPSLYLNNIELDPGFVDETNHNFYLQSTSNMIDRGAFLTNTVGSGSNSNIMIVDDAGYFYDGYNIISEDGDSIQLIGSLETANILNIDYTTNTLTLDNNLNWRAGQGVNLPYTGAAPDIGANEYNPLIVSINDYDSDGIPNGIDRCTNTPLSLVSHVNRYGCPMPIATKFDIKPDFNHTNINLSRITDFDIGISSHGKISYRNRIIRFMRRVNDNYFGRMDFDSGINISHNRVELNTSILSELNTSTNITFYNVGLTNPKILKDGENCSSLKCQIIYWNSTFDTLVTTVPHFSVYELVEGEVSVPQNPGPPPDDNGNDQGTGTGGDSGSNPNTPDCTSGQSQVCGSDTGLCIKGVQLCINSKWGTCNATGPVAEVCDGADNNCDGTIDEDVCGSGTHNYLDCVEGAIPGNPPCVCGADNYIEGYCCSGTYSDDPCMPAGNDSGTISQNSGYDLILVIIAILGFLFVVGYLLYRSGKQDEGSNNKDSLDAPAPIYNG